MRSYENHNTFHNFIAMLSAHSSDSLIVVMEGDDDPFLLKNWVSGSVIVRAGQGGKGQILRVAERFVAEGNDRVRFVVDRDYDDFAVPSVVYPSNVVVSHHHDCFVDVLSVNQYLLAQIVDYRLDSRRRSDNKYADLARGASVASLVDRAFELASMLAACRIVDLRGALNLNFKAFKFVGHDNEMLNASYIMRVLHVGFGGSDVVLNDRCDKVERIASELGLLDFPLVGDHDLFAAVNYVLGEYGQSVPDKLIRTSIISSISILVLRELIWCNVLEDWANSHGISFFVER